MMLRGEDEVLGNNASGAIHKLIGLADEISTVLRVIPVVRVRRLLRNIERRVLESHCLVEFVVVRNKADVDGQTLCYSIWHYLHLLLHPILQLIHRWLFTTSHSASS